LEEPAQVAPGGEGGKNEDWPERVTDEEYAKGESAE
jgi:hypothetical protein